MAVDMTDYLNSWKFSIDMWKAHTVESVNGRCATHLVLRPERRGVVFTSVLTFITLSLSRLAAIVNSILILLVHIFRLDVCHDLDKG